MTGTGFRDSPARIMGAVLALESLTTVGMALWLFWVIATVLPSRDPGHIPMWRTVAVGLIAYSALCWASVAAWPRAPLLRWLVLVTSVAAIGLGLYGVIDMLQRTDAHFEGYLLVMGLVLAGHGLTGIAYALVSARPTTAPDPDLASPIH